MHLLVAIGKGILNVVLSFIIGGIALVYCSEYYPDVMNNMQAVSATIKSILNFVGLFPSQPNALQTLLFDDNLFALLFFIIATRITLSILSTIYSAIFGGEDLEYSPYERPTSQPQPRQQPQPQRPQNPGGYQQQNPNFRQPQPQPQPQQRTQRPGTYNMR